MSVARPVLLLIPGMLNTAAIWREVTPHLEGLADVRIASVLTQSSIAGMARDAWQQVADVPVDTPLVICGFSMGGYTALEMLAHPVRAVNGLALLDTSARPESAEGRVAREKTIAAIEKNFPRAVDGVLQFGTATATQTRSELMQAIRQVMLDAGAEAAIRQNHALMARADSLAFLKTLAMPVLVMCGREDRITPPELSSEMAALIPGARLEWLADAGHMTPLEQPARVAELLKALL
jgi:pimeloyl-ACP methyl ester carboxylesterase